MAKPLVLKSGIHKVFTKNFALEEDTANRISQILKEASKELGYASAVVLYVYKENDRFYETTEIDEVFSDPNIDGKEIKSFNIELRNSDPERQPERWQDDWIVQIIFSNFHKDDPVVFKIYAGNKGWALLLSDKLEPHIEAALVKNSIPDFILIPLYASITFLGFKFFSNLMINTEIPKALLYAVQTVIIICCIVLSLLTLSIGKERATFLKKHFGPESVFLWGAQITGYKNRQNIRNGIFWGVVVSFLVSFAANAFFYLK